MTVRNNKSQACVRSDYATQDAAHWRDGIPPGGYFEKDAEGVPDHSRPVFVNGEPALGIMVGNVPLGTDAYVLEYLKSKQKFILRGFLKIMKILDTR